MQKKNKLAKALCHTQCQGTDELYHHGILGMHWGVRRYQNEDGTLTALGRARNASVDGVPRFHPQRTTISEMAGNRAYSGSARDYGYYSRAFKTSPAYQREFERSRNEYFDRINRAPSARAISSIATDAVGKYYDAHDTFSVHLDNLFSGNNASVANGYKIINDMLLGEATARGAKLGSAEGVRYRGGGDISKYTQQKRTLLW